MGMLIRNFEGSLRNTKNLLNGCGLKFFSPLRDTNSKPTYDLLSFFFSAQLSEKVEQAGKMALSNPHGLTLWNN